MRVHAECARYFLGLIHQSGPLSQHIDFLKRDNIRRSLRDHLGDALW